MYKTSTKNGDIQCYVYARTYQKRYCFLFIVSYNVSIISQEHITANVILPDRDMLHKHEHIKMKATYKFNVAHIHYQNFDIPDSIKHQDVI